MKKVIVIGSGILGASTAYQLAKMGANVIIVDRIEELKSEGETGYAQVGALSIHDDLEKIRKMEERARIRKADAPEIGEITRLNEKKPMNGFLC